MRIKKLKGLSGCDVSLHINPNNDRKFVRKISSGKSYNDRLMSQMSKQASFKSDLLKTPEIYDSGFEGEKFYFDMEFIKGVTFHNFISTHSPNTVSYIFDKLRRYLSQKDGTVNNFTPEIEEKINSLRSTIDPNLHKFLDYCHDHDWTKIDASLCHGDLTFENIIIYKSDVYLIDFLDSFMETKYIDYSKVLQDILFMWSWRNSTSTPLIKCMNLYNILVQDVNEKEQEVIRRLLLLNILRIFPYAGTQTLAYLSNILTYAEDKFEIK